MHRYQEVFHALGSDAVLTIVTEIDSTHAKRLMAELKDSITAFEKRFSRFLPDSELTEFNRRAGEKTPVSPPFRRLLATARDLSIQTDGLYNPFILPVLQQAGYKGSWPKPAAAVVGTDFEGRMLAPIRALNIGDTWAKIPGDTALDFGGIGKGYLLDMLARVTSTWNIAGYWLSLGGDIVCSGYDLDGQEWQVAVQDATNPTENVRSITNRRGEAIAIATSGVTKRKGIKGDTRWHHIIDPRTGHPAETDILTATVIAQRATTADVFAKVAVIVGSEQARQLCRDAEGVESLVMQLRESEH